MSNVGMSNLKSDIQMTGSGYLNITLAIGHPVA